MKLSDIKVRNIKAKDKPLKLSDGEGLYIHVLPSGSKLWRMAYTIFKRSTFIDQPFHGSLRGFDTRWSQAQSQERFL